MAFSKIPYFPLGLALGEAFCNREKERTRLKYNIEKGTSSLLISPRRYGKTSLVLQTLSEMAIPFSYIDFFPELNEEDIVQAILNGVGHILGQLESIPKRALRLVNEFFTGTQTRVIVGEGGIKIEIERQPKRLTEQLMQALTKLDHLAKTRNQKVVLFLDELQKLAEIGTNIAIEGVLRHVAQEAKYLGFIFSGSHRHILQSMFDDRARPFYNLCDKVILGRISAEDYKPFIQKAAQARWQKTLDEDFLNEFLTLVKRHPYYINVIGSRLWSVENPPTIPILQTYWKEYQEEEKARVKVELDLLSANQKKLLIALARFGHTLAPMSIEFVKKSGIALASIRQALHSLEAKDYLVKDSENRYHLIDPLISSVIS